MPNKKARAHLKQLKDMKHNLEVIQASGRRMSISYEQQLEELTSKLAEETAKRHSLELNLALVHKEFAESKAALQAKSDKVEADHAAQRAQLEAQLTRLESQYGKLGESSEKIKARNDINLVVIKNLRETLAQEREKAAGQKQDIKQRVVELRRMRKLLSKESVKVAELSAQLEAAKQALLVKSAAFEHLEHKVLGLEDELDIQADTVSTLDQALRDSKAKLTPLEAEVAAKAQALAAVEAEYAALQVRSESLHQSLVEVNAAYSAIESENTRLKQELLLAKSELTRGTELIGRLEDKVRAAETHSLGVIADTALQLTDLFRRNAELNAMLTELEDENLSLKGRLAVLSVAQGISPATVSYTESTAGGVFHSVLSLPSAALLDWGDSDASSESSPTP